MRTIEQMIQQEINCNVSALVSQLAQSYGHRDGDTIAETVNQAFELACPVDDYEEAARQEGWNVKRVQDGAGEADVEFFAWTGGTAEQPEHESGFCKTESEAWQAACELAEIEPYQWEVYEFWAISSWFAEKLAAAGEKVDSDFAGLNVWARTTTGQAISMDGVVQRIYAEMMAA